MVVPLDNNLLLLGCSIVINVTRWDFGGLRVYNELLAGVSRTTAGQEYSIISASGASVWNLPTKAFVVLEMEPCGMYLNKITRSCTRSNN